jgi:hypothetical protein
MCTNNNGASRDLSAFNCRPVWIDAVVGIRAFSSSTYDVKPREPEGPQGLTRPPTASGMAVRTPPG